MLNTPRTLYRLLGMLRFASSILCWPRRQLGRWTRYQSGVAKDDIQWDVESNDPEFLRVLEDMKLMILSIKNEFVHPKSHIPVKRSKDDVLFVAVDATETHWAMWPMADGEVVKKLCREDTFRDGENTVRVPIDYGEAYTFEQGVLHLQKTRATVWNIANDNNKGVGRTFVSGFSCADIVDEVIKGVRIPLNIPQG